MKRNRASHRPGDQFPWLAAPAAQTRIMCASNGDDDWAPCGNEPLDFKSRLVSPAGTKGLPAGCKRPQTLLFRLEPPTKIKGLKEQRQMAP
jgi:hypothetical protein